jgi:type I restriction enzyme S subunit
MIGHYPLAQMSQFLRLRKEFFTIDDAATYQLVTVQLHARGIRERQQLAGVEIKTKRQQRIQAGDLLVAEIDAKVGGFGIVPTELSGAIVSSHYFLYEIDTSQIDPRYLEYYLKSGRPEQDVQQFVKGSVNYAAIRPHHFPQLHMPLPPLDEQRRIVARMEALAGRIAEAQGLQDGVLNESVAVLASATDLEYCRAASRWGACPLTEVSQINPSRCASSPTGIHSGRTGRAAAGGAGQGVSGRVMRVSGS